MKDCLEKGPHLTLHVFEVLAKFRSYPVGLTADIEKAFHQISVNSADRDQLRFVWFKNIKEERPEIVQYRFRRLVFGLTSSPAILNGTIQHHLSHYKEPEPQVSELLANSLYVDDFPGGASDNESAIHVYQRAKAIMKEGGFNLYKWKTNSSIVRQRISEEMKEEDDKSEVKILGLNWDTMSDELRFEFVSVMEYLKSLPPTKRSVLKLSAKLFDPLGLLSPFVVNMKIWFQKLRVDKVNWDDRLEGTMLAKWNHLFNEFSSSTKLNIQRCYFVREKSVCGQLHGFSDASEQVIAAVVYLRTVYEAGDVDVQLIASKTKVPPLKKQSIPRLELMGAYIFLSKLVDTVCNAFKLLPFEVDVYYWVDSFTTLCWIKNHRPWKQYVQHKVDVICKMTDREKWRFCPGNMKPVDIPSRGCSGKDLVESELWWSGPTFLREPSNLWPETPPTSAPNTTSEELVKQTLAITHSLATAVLNRTLYENLEEMMDIERYGSKLKLLRLTAYMMKFIWLLMGDRGAVKSKDLRTEDLNFAEVTWIQGV